MHDSIAHRGTALRTDPATNPGTESGGRSPASSSAPGLPRGPAARGRRKGLPLAAGLALCSALAGAARAGGEVSQVLVEDVPATPFRYSADGRTYTWGLGRNQVMSGFVADGVAYGYTDTVSRVELRRDDIGDVAEGNPCGVFVERLDAGGESLAADYPSDGSDTGECDMPELLASRIVNRGALDLFSNVLPDAKNIERADFVFDHGIAAPFVDGGRAKAGHVVGEKRGNNPVRMAAILALDVFGQPAEYGPLVQIDGKHCAPARLCYGETDLVHEYSFFQNERLVPQGFPSETGQSVETVAMAFVDLRRLGLHAGQRYFGFSLFADDVDRNAHVLTDPSTFPNDTSDDYISVGDDADIYGGLAGYFVADELNGASGRVYLDENDDGAFGSGDAAVPGIALTLYEDTDGNGAFDPLVDRALCDAIDSDGHGRFRFPGLADGSYFVVLHEGDPDVPDGLTLVPGTNPRPVFVSGADVDDVDFAFSNGDSSGGGNGGGTDAGGADTGGAGTGGSSDGADAGDDGAGDGAADGGADDGGAGGGGAGDGGAADAGAGDGGAGNGGAGDGGAGDGGAADGGAGDGGAGDGGAGDGGAGDGGAGDGGAGDGGAADGGAGDGGAGDGGAGDGGAGDGGAGDGGAGDGGAGDGGAADGGAGDGGTGDGGDGGVIGTPDNDDSSTTAVPDRATVRQGGSVVIDVLANDTDASGGGLAIVALGASPDATVTIVPGAGGAQAVRYEPDFGFFGDDAFTYTIEDADGARATGTVQVAVTRYSDIDGNGINDFDECDCTDLTLETGVRGSGLGAASPWSIGGLALVIAAAFARRLRAARSGAAA